LITELTSTGKLVLFVGTKRQAQTRWPKRQSAAGCRTSTRAGWAGCYELDYGAEVGEAIAWSLDDMSTDAATSC